MSTQDSGTSKRRPRPRLESLSDLIYGLSLSIGAISLVITNGPTATIDEVNRSIVNFVVVFLILITSWMVYTTDMSVLPTETRLITALNVILLILVAIIPYLFDQLVGASTVNVQDYASQLFALDLAGTLLILAGFAHIIALEEKNLVEREVQARFRSARNRMLVLTIVVLASLAIPWDLVFQTVHVRQAFWYIPIFSYWFNRMRSRPFGRAQIPEQ